jgi:hypothetical protein
VSTGWAATSLQKHNSSQFTSISNQISMVNET